MTDTTTMTGPAEAAAILAEHYGRTVPERRATHCLDCLAIGPRLVPEPARTSHPSGVCALHRWTPPDRRRK